MADCTKTVEFLREWRRMCDKYTPHCDGCPMSVVNNGTEHLCREFVCKDNRAVATVQKWSDEHPVMTWEGKLREWLPNVDARSVCNVTCPYDIFGGDATKKGTCACDTYVDCDHCWSGEYKEG